MSGLFPITFLVYISRAANARLNCFDFPLNFFLVNFVSRVLMRVVSLQSVCKLLSNQLLLSMSVSVS